MADLVAPFAGAWIETMQERDHAGREPVAPFAGAWIETSGNAAVKTVSSGRALRGRVDRNHGTGPDGRTEWRRALRGRVDRNGY